MSVKSFSNRQQSSQVNVALPESILTWQIILEEIENAIHSYQSVGLGESGCESLESPEFRQKLIEYAKAGIQEISSSLKTQRLPYNSLEMRLHLETYLYRGIETILKGTNLRRRS
jgi:hypothetical protein